MLGRSFKLREAIEFVGSLFLALFVALMLRSFLYESYFIPSGSMKPLLLEGDFLFVAKYPYGFSNHSLPFSPPLISGRVLVNKKPERGQVLVFRHADTNYIKRLIGMPGEVIQVKQSKLYINNTQVPREYVGKFIDQDGMALEEYREILPGGTEVLTLDAGPGHRYDDVGPFTVPEGHYFMMGDNRDNSADSRAHIGYVSFEQIIGRADIIFLSARDSLFKFWTWPTSLRFRRILLPVMHHVDPT